MRAPGGEGHRVRVIVVQPLSHVWLWLQHTRLLCPSLAPGVCSNLSPLCQWCHPTISSSVVPFFFCPQSFPASGSFLMSWLFASGGPKYGSFSFSVSSSNEYSGLISFKIDWFDLLAVQGTLKSLLQHHSSKASILWRSAFFIVQLWHLYMTGKTIIRVLRGQIKRGLVQEATTLEEASTVLGGWWQGVVVQSIILGGGKWRKPARGTTVSWGAVG